MSQFIDFNNVPLFESFCRRQQVDGKTIEAKIGKFPFKLKVVTTPKSQAKGYMDADSAPSDCEGMLFVYDIAAPLTFWMKNVRFPLDIIFFDSDLNYINHETMQPYSGSDYGAPRYVSAKPARFAVETQAGWCDNNIDKNCTLEI